MNNKLAHYECDGQMSIFDFIDKKKVKLVQKNEKGGAELGIDVITIVLIILLLISFLGRCVLDWIELRDEWWEMISYEPEEEDGKEGEGENNKL